MHILVNSPLLSINKSIFAVGTLVSLPLWLLVSLLRRNLKKELIIAYLEVGGLRVALMFNKNIIKLRDNKEYIKEAVNTIAILCIK